MILKEGYDSAVYLKDEDVWKNPFPDNQITSLYGVYGFTLRKDG